MRSSYLGRNNSGVGIEKCEIEIAIKKGLASPNIKQTQVPVTLAGASTVNKVQS